MYQYNQHYLRIKKLITACGDTSRGERITANVKGICEVAALAFLPLHLLGYC
jgi:hypothetical protein